MSLARNFLDTEYRVLRAPTRLMERRILARLPEESFIRMGAEGGLGLLDTLAGRVVGNRDVRQRGTALLDGVQASWRARRGPNDATQLRTPAVIQEDRRQQSADTVAKVASDPGETVPESAPHKLAAVDEE
ncbi:MAG: hypothetical protein LLG14_07195 [Nocardiaceae bacterium]|nr:hypothetical protein [Nocardiaceae bacterium]